MTAMSKSVSKFFAAFAAAVLAVGLHGGSLWTAPGASERPGVADKKASRVGDIITVVVSETSSALNTQKTKSSKASSMDSGISKFLFSPAASGMGTHNGELPGTEFKGGSDFTSSGEVNTRASLSARAAVLVKDVLPNGNLVIEGARHIVFGGETQFAMLSGLVRPEDITSFNTVSSSAIANARVEFVSEGNLTEAQKKGWVTKVFDFLRPY